ncbi:uncharacterized protein LOC123541470 [Mercenaria mercenaria]|uniref:uncharacterized protein LOC123541470 n=1 Tax=Mercenaria mercenaria TaxID=6596 RepID=UPI00234ED3BA|nr:uncharacterized protein LOC123541470 [Mercenaria mercenaria]XP_053382534.1 uncharacterized protein LOC123541470 [Mercenaria mercenaria]XP_053382535.1 uncharacterized protein LOC123541470 [Mercenaria mercenaria]XP_053382536.1 uncharacterized protein LOC123541470 [Mercenaria mercenaria]XP_053382537.1 uncharacterized protein LOC123541470 [Mercenaria mercenaria]
MADAQKSSGSINWVKCALGFRYLKNGLEGCCEEIATKQHKEILNDIKQNKKLLKLVCGQCSIDTLKPDHVQNMSKHCPLGQIQCNCQSPRGKVSCRNKICGAIYDKIITHHASVPPSPNWKNTNSHSWCTSAWEIAKCFIPEDGYKQTKSAFDTDCAGLLSIIINDLDFGGCMLQTDSLTQLKRARNELIYSAPHELDEKDNNKYLDIMIAVLKDVPKLNTRMESKAAMRRIKKLRSGRYCYDSEDEIDVLEDSCESIKNELLRRVGDILQVQLKAMDNLKAFRLSDMSRREITQATQYLKDIWSKAEISKRQKPSVEVFKDITHLALRPPPDQLRQRDQLTGFQHKTLASFQSMIQQKYSESVEKVRMTKQELDESTSQIAALCDLEGLFQSCMERLRFLKQIGGNRKTYKHVIDMNTSLSMPSTSSASEPCANVKQFLVKDNCFPRYEYAMENIIDILKRYKTVFSLKNDVEPVSRCIAIYFCKANNEIDFPCNINDIVPEHSNKEICHEREFSYFSDCLGKRDKSMFSLFLVSGNMEELWESESHQEAIDLICARSEREARAISKRQSVRSRENVLIIRKETARQQIEKYLEKGIFQCLNPVCEALLNSIECARRNENIVDNSTFATKIKSPVKPGSKKRKGKCRKFEITGNEEKSKKMKISEGKKTTEKTKDRHGNRDHAIMTQTADLNRSAEGRKKSASEKNPFSKHNTAKKFTISFQGEGEGPQQLSNLLEVNEEVLRSVNEQTKECLLEELIGLFNMSDVSVQEMLNIQQHSQKMDLETLSKDLFAQCPAVTGVGYRMRKLQIAVKDIQNFDKAEKSTEICQILKQHNVKDYEIVTMSLKTYLTPGDEICVAQNRGSFGCFAKMQDREERGETACGLLSKHVATTDQERSEILAKNDGQFKRIGHILQETITDGGLDIAAATLSIPIGECETRFKSLRGRPQETGRGRLFETERLRGNKVHMWGAVSKPGKGIITVPDYICKGMDHTLIQVEDIVDGEQNVVDRFAQPGDSGAVTCADDPGQRVVHPVSMNIGCMNYKEVEEDNKNEVKTKRGKYLTVPLQSGLEQLSQRTGKNFDLF